MRQPLTSHVCRPLPRAWMWNRGRARRKRSRSVICQQVTRFTAFDAKLSCVSTAPFDVPVVPEV